MLALYLEELGREGAPLVLVSAPRIHLPDLDCMHMSSVHVFVLLTWCASTSQSQLLQQGQLVDDVTLLLQDAAMQEERNRVTAQLQRDADQNRQNDRHAEAVERQRAALAASAAKARFTRQSDTERVMQLERDRAQRQAEAAAARRSGATQSQQSQQSARPHATRLPPGPGAASRLT